MHEPEAMSVSEAYVLGDPAEQRGIDERTWGAGLLPVLIGEPSKDLMRELVRITAGLALSAVYGVALGARGGLESMVRHALTVPLSLAAVVTLAAPSFYILLAHGGSRLAPLPVLAAVRRGVGVCALLLGGLSPAATLLAVSSEGPLAAALYGALGLALAGVLGLRQLIGDLRLALSREDDTPRGSHAAVLGFALFTALLATKIWAGMPLFQGAP